MFATTAPTLTNAFARGGDLTAKFRKMTVSSSRATTGNRTGLVVESTCFSDLRAGCERSLAGWMTALDVGTGDAEGDGNRTGTGVN
jgi:hypothetical protein